MTFKELDNCYIVLFDPTIDYSNNPLLNIAGKAINTYVINRTGDRIGVRLGTYKDKGATV